MKFFEMNTLQACAAMESIAEPLKNILDHEAFRAVMADIQSAKRPFDVLNMILPVLVGPCLNDAAAVLSVMIGKDAEEIKQQPILKTVADIRALVKDLNGVDIA